MDVTALNLSYLDTNIYRSSSSSKVQDSNFSALFEKINSAQNSKSDNSLSSSAGSSANVTKYSAKTPIDKTDQLYELCLELETFIVKNLLNGMRNTVQKSGLIDDSFAGKMYEDMLYDEYAKDFTKNANFGLAEQAYRQLKRQY